MKRMFLITLVALFFLCLPAAAGAQSPAPPIGYSGIYSGYSGYYNGYYYNPYTHLCSASIPMRMWPRPCMGELKFDTGKLKKVKAEDIDARINGDNKGPVSKHDNARDPAITLPPSDLTNSGAPHRYHIEIVAKGTTIVLFEDWITVPSLLQSGYKPLIFHVSDNDFVNSPLTAEVVKEHRTIKANELIRR